MADDTLRASLRAALESCASEYSRYADCGIYADVKSALIKLDGYGPVLEFESTGEWPRPETSTHVHERRFWCEMGARNNERMSGAAVVASAWVALPHHISDGHERASFARWLTENEEHLAAEHVRGELIRLLEHFTLGNGEHPPATLTWAEFRDGCIFPCWEWDGPGGIDDAREFLREARHEVEEHPEEYAQWPKLVSEVTGVDALLAALP